MKVVEPREGTSRDLVPKPLLLLVRADGYMGSAPLPSTSTKVEDQEIECAGAGKWASRLPAEHQAKFCTQNVKCYNCNGEGHTSRECQMPRAEKACHRCNEIGHLARDCPTNPMPPQECYKCGQIGHLSRSCPQNMSAEQGPKCFSCGRFGHLSRECRQGRACFNCGRADHISRECPEPKKPQTCRKCGVEGHIMRECPN
ncbi:hypothetical protein GGF32_009283 [Allomyces javanicus]|nr:hypothetical protein GGF32_009283 [Allomyces javanicus]